MAFVQKTFMSPEGIVSVERTPGELENTYSTFMAPDGRKMLIFSLEFGPRQAVVDWAKGLVLPRGGN